MKIFVVGSGKLANAILNSDTTFPSSEILKWETRNQKKLMEKSIVVHAGSGRQLRECMDFCERTGSIFIELSTGLETEKTQPNFTLIICPNTSILLLKVLNIVKTFGSAFERNKISITESHQASKTTEPGTAYSFAKSLNFPLDRIVSIRDPETQLNQVGIPRAYLDKHAYHKIVIGDGLDEVTIETKVLGHSSYVSGVKKIIETAMNNAFERKRYSVFDLIDENML
jgi:4-hydroxy-tetrahydrodipicolinate reductase